METEYLVDGWNNFCRVFELPERYSSKFCFGGGVPTEFKMVDWFNPVADIPQPAVSKDVWERDVGDIAIAKITLEDLSSKIVPFLMEKSYVTKGRKYLVICDFDLTFIFEGKK